MSRRALIAAAIATVVGAVYFLYPRSAPKREKREEVVEAPPPKGPQLTADGRSLVPPPEKPRIEKAPVEKAPPPKKEAVEPPEVDEKNDPLIGLDLEEPTSAELTELKVPEGMTGVVVKRVDPASPAAEAKLERGDVIVRAQRDKITSERSLRAAVGDRDQTVLTVYRHGYPFQVVLHKPFHAEP